MWFFCGAGRDDERDHSETEKDCIVVGASMVLTIATENGFVGIRALPKKTFFGEDGGLGTPTFKLILLMALILSDTLLFRANTGKV